MRTKARTRSADELGIVDVKDLVENIYKLDISRITGNEAYFLCPSHQDHNPSASVNLKSGLWHCWVCNDGGDIVNLGSKVLGIGRKKMFLTLTPTDTESKRVAVIRACDSIRRNQERAKRNEEEGFKDRVQDPSEFDAEPLSYMTGRGFTEKTLEDFGVRYARKVDVRTRTKKKYVLYEVVCIPIYNAKIPAELVAWCFRKTPRAPEPQPRYFYTTGFKTTDNIFGELQVADAGVDAITVCEGPIDAMWLWQAGIPAVATFGTGSATNPKKVEYLSNFRKVTIFGDHDEAGAKFARDLGGLLRASTSVTVARYKSSWSGTDPNGLTEQQCREAVARAINLHEWEM